MTAEQMNNTTVQRFPGVARRLSSQILDQRSFQASTVCQPKPPKPISWYRWRLAEEYTVKMPGVVLRFGQKGIPKKIYLGIRKTDTDVE